MHSHQHDTGVSSHRELPVIIALQRAVHIIGVHLEAALGDLRLSQGEMHVLSLLGHGGTLSVTELQRGVRHRSSTLTGILDRLEGKGLVARRINEADRRSNLIELTQQGQSAARRVLEAMESIERSAFGDCSPEQVQTFREMLQALG